jgi:gentisate 1,2-dioxygenase
MRPGDLVITPGWTWHDHGNLGAEPVVWLDGLDTAFANMLGANFREDYPEDTQPVTRSEDAAAARHGIDLLPADYRAARGASPILSYPYEPTREALAHLARSGPPNPWHGYKMRYGGHPFPTMAVFMQFLPDGFAGRDYRSTESKVFCVVEGRGSAAIGETHFDFAPHDVFVVPSWERYRVDAQGNCVLFSYSDVEAQERLGFWREQM